MLSPCLHGSEASQVYGSLMMEIRFHLFFLDAPQEAEILSRELPNYRGSFNMGTTYGHWDLIMPTYNASHVEDAMNFFDNFVVDACKL